MWPVVKELCDHGCWLVVLVRCRATGRMLAYCRDCGAAWPSPLDLDRGSFINPIRECPRGFEVPSRAQVAGSLWAGTAIRFVSDDEFTTASEINDDLAWEREGRPPRPSRPGGLASGSRLREDLQILFIVPPIALVIGSCVPLWFVAKLLAYLLGIPDNVPVRDQPFGIVWGVLVMIAMVMHVIAGGLLGFLLNAWIARSLLGWSWVKVRDSGVCSPPLFARWIESRVRDSKRTMNREPPRNPMHDPQLDDSV